jgi:aspartyl-tRNA(Asn)/glutamyl-tRNA(Gln) amidotransferase subunit A
MERPLHYQTLTEIAARLARREMSATELTEHFLARIEALDGTLNAFRLVTTDRAMEAAAEADRRRLAGETGPLLGIPFAAKDLFDVRGLATTAGTRLLETSRAAANATVIERLERAGMTLLGKTNTVQFAYGGVGINHDHGTPHNPWQETHHVPGGSSSGSAVSVAAGMAPSALGTDTGGSVRIPAALCGVTGLKTTVGRVSRAGVYPLSWTLDSVGPLARSVEDAALVYDAMQGEDPSDATTAGRPANAACPGLADGVRGLRLAYAESVFWDDAQADVAAAVRAGKEVFEEAGAVVSSIEFREAEEARALNSRGLIIAGEAWTVNRRFMEEHFDDLDPIVAHRMIKGKSVSAEEYLGVMLEVHRLRCRLGATFEKVDALLVPTTPIAALPLAAVDLDTARYSEHNLLYLRNTAIGNVLNLCGVSVPCGFTTLGLPVGLMIYAPPFREDLALRIGHRFQQRTDWHLRTPLLGWAAR